LPLLAYSKKIKIIEIKVSFFIILFSSQKFELIVDLAGKISVFLNEDYIQLSKKQMLQLFGSLSSEDIVILIGRHQDPRIRLILYSYIHSDLLDHTIDKKKFSNLFESDLLSYFHEIENQKKFPYYKTSFRILQINGLVQCILRDSNKSKEIEEKCVKLGFHLNS